MQDKSVSPAPSKRKWLPPSTSLLGAEDADGTVKNDLLNNGVDEPKLFAYPTTTGGQLGNLQWATYWENGEAKLFKNLP